MSIEFNPLSIAQVRPFFQRLDSSTITIIENDYRFDSNLDGKRGLSELEKCLYVTAGYNNNKDLVLNGIYFYRRNVLLNPNYSRAVSQYQHALDIVVAKDKND